MAKFHSGSAAHIPRDLGIIALSIFIAFNLAENQTFERIIAYSGSFGYLSAFVAGIFFTSIFSAAPATVALFEISKSGTPLLPVVILGALGAMIGDYIIFRFVRDPLSADLSAILKRFGKDRLKIFMKLSYLRWFIVFLGGLIIASPLPDEIGLAMMGFSKLDSRTFAVLSFFCNALGIAVIWYLAWIA